jgi:GrpB-like predicted nucleotidyltransferase (UPF0157 family)
MQPILPFETVGETGYVVQYHPYDPKLPAVFAELKRLIQEASGAATVEHVGSTSIPGVGGRNAIDIAIPIVQAERERVRAAMLMLGFTDSPFPHYLPLLVGRFGWQGTKYPVLLYLVPAESPVYEDWLRFRAHMRSNPADARAYDAVKRQAIGSGSVDGERYQAAKTPFVESVAAKLR